MQKDKEWYSLRELVELTEVPYPKIRSAVFNLRKANLIKWRDNILDARVIEIHRESIQLIKQAIGLDS